MRNSQWSKIMIIIIIYYRVNIIESEKRVKYIDLARKLNNNGT